MRRGDNSGMLAVWLALGIIAFAIILENLALILAYVVVGIAVAGAIVVLWLLIKDYLR